MNDAIMHLILLSGFSALLLLGGCVLYWFQRRQLRKRLNTMPHDWAPRDPRHVDTRKAWPGLGGHDNEQLRFVGWAKDRDA